MIPERCIRRPGRTAEAFSIGSRGTEAGGFGREMAAVFPETYVSMPQLLTRINGRPATGELVTGNYFSLLGVPAIRGRMLRPSDSEAPGREPVVVLSHAAWMRLFGGDPAAVGQQLQIRGVYVEIVGIAPEGFVGLDLLPRDFWAPLTLLPALEVGPSLFGPEQPQRLEVVGRLGPTQTEASARAAVLAWAQRTTASNPPETQAVVAILQPAATPIALSFNVLLAFTPLLVAFALVLLTAAANLAGLMLSRATVRQREIAIRLSLGASRGRIVRQFFVESLLLALLASMAGFALGRVTLDAGIRAGARHPAPGGGRLYPAPARGPRRARAGGADRGGYRYRRRVRRPARPPRHPPRRNDRLAWRHARRTDVAASSWAGRRADHGVGAAHHHMRRAAARVSTSGHNGPRAADARCHRSAHQEPIQRDRARHAARASAGPHGCCSVDVDVRSGSAGDRLGRGRTVRGAGAHAAEAGLARLLRRVRYRPHERASLHRGGSQRRGARGHPEPAGRGDALARPERRGRLVRLAPDSRVPDAYKPPSPVVEVVGVARTVFTSWDQAMRATIYSPMSVAGFNLNILVKTRGGNVSAALRQIDADLSAAAPGVAEQIITAQDLVDTRVYPFQAMSWAAGVIGGIALVLTISGIYGVLAYAVARRTKEIGLRMTLGASAAGVVGLILEQSMRLCAIGLGIGLTLAVALSTALASTLVMMDTFDVAAFSAGIVIVIAACLVAAFYPARRAAGVEPMVALRIE